MNEKYPGLKSVLEMLRILPQQEQETLLKTLAAKDPKLAEVIRSELFQVSDLLRIRAVDLNKVLRSFERPLLLKALKAAPENIRMHIASGMGPREKKDFLEDFASQGLHRLSEVKSALQELLMYIKLLVDSGRLAIGSMVE